jgi:hypothetical protein
VAKRTYVPGYGYVTQGSRGTSGSVPVRTPPSSGGYTPGTGFRVDTSKAGTGKPPAKTATGVSKDRFVVYPNWRYQVSAADVYSGRDPADPTSGMWNIGLSKEDAIGMWDSDDFSPQLRDYLDRVAKSQHPMKKGKTLWSEAVGTAYALQGRGENVTPWSVLTRKYFSTSGDPMDPGAGPGGGGYRSYGGGGGGGGGSSSSVSLTDPTSARGLLMQTMQGILGRDPTNNEYKNFLKVLNEAEMANPRSVELEGDVAVQSGGIDPGVLALEFAQDQEDFAERQGDQFFRTFMQALAGGV